MRHRLAIMNTVRQEDDGGGFARADVVLSTVWGRVNTIGALEQNSYSQLQERTTHKAIIRWRSDVDQGQTVIWLSPGTPEPEPGDPAPAGTALYVVSALDADPDGRPREFLELTLREGGNL